MSDLHTRDDEAAGPLQTMQRRSARHRHPSAGLTRAPIGHRSLNFLALGFITLTLNLIGLVMVLSASSIQGLEQEGSTFFYFQRQAIWMSIGVVVAVVAMRFDYRRLAALTPLALIGTAVLLVSLHIPGVGITANGSTRWLGVGPITIQPSEMAKLTVVLVVANLLSRRVAHMDNPKLTEYPVLLVAGGAFLLIFLQPSQGTAMIVAATAGVVWFVAGAPLHRLFGWAVAFSTLAVLGATLEPYRLRRVQAVLNPWDDPLSTGFHTIQSLVGVASGGVSGVGLGQGRAKWGFLPFAHTDFIFSVIAEELGLFGACFIVALFFLIVLFGVMTALAAPDRYGVLLASGITAWVGMQAFINIGAALGVLPISGVPLPFVSVGGSSLVVTMAAMGILLNIARQGRRLSPLTDEDDREPVQA